MKRIKTLLLALAASFITATAQTDEITVHNDQNGRDEVIDLPEGMSVSCDSLINEWMAKKYLYPDTTCANPDYNPTFTTEEYQERLRRLPVVMEMPYNSVVQKFIDQYSGRLRRTVSYALGAGNFYIPIFEEALDYYGLPLELKYLPVIESALEPKAKSPAGAVGLWQFMLATGKRYDLKVNSLIDERQDPYKSSWAAARYLRDLYKIYRDWNLVIAAYNCGPANVNKAIHRAGGVHDYWTIYPYLPAETRGYVPAFIAANYVMNYYCEHNICPMKTKYPLSTDTLLVNRDLHLEQVMAFTGLDKEAIQALNPHRCHSRLCGPHVALPAHRGPHGTHRPGRLHLQLPLRGPAHPPRYRGRARNAGLLAAQLRLGLPFAQQPEGHQVEVGPQRTQIQEAEKASHENSHRTQGRNAQRNRRTQRNFGEKTSPAQWYQRRQNKHRTKTAREITPRAVRSFVTANSIL